MMHVVVQQIFGSFASAITIPCFLYSSNRVYVSYLIGKPSGYDRVRNTEIGNKVGNLRHEKLSIIL